jgi:4-hydroxy-2-oxoheptanedioate aldolase
MAWLQTADPYVAEIVAAAGFDSLVLDAQHGMGIGQEQTASWLQAVSLHDTVPVVRVGWNEPAYIQWALDAGAYGVIVPLVNSLEEATKAGKATRYAPLGYRSVGPNRARFYGGADYEMKANDEMVCLVMIERSDTVARVEELAQAPGIDGFYIGPADLAMSMGLPPRGYQGESRHAEACQQVLDAAKKHGLVCGIQTASPEEAIERYEQGFLYCSVLIATAALGRTAAAALKTVGDVLSR